MQSIKQAKLYQDTNIKIRDKVFHYLFLTIFLIIVVHASLKIIKSPLAKGDLEVFTHASNLILRNENIYLTPSREIINGGTYYIYLPLLAILLIPLSVFPMEVRVFIWSFINALLVFWIIKLFYEMMSGEKISSLSIKENWILCFVPILLTLPAIQHHLSYGQVNIPIMALTVFGISLISKKYEITGGFIIGFVFLIKIITLPILILIVFKKMYRSSFGLCSGITFGLIILPSLVIGFEQNISYIHYWLNKIILGGDLTTNHVPLLLDFSLQAQLQRFFTDAGIITFQGNLYSITIYSISVEKVRLTRNLLQILVLAIPVYYSIKYRGSLDLVSKWGAIVLAFAIIPLFSIITEKHYFVTLLPAYFYAVYVWYYFTLKDIRFRCFLISSVVVKLMTVSGIVGNQLSDIFAVLGFHLLANVLLCACLFRIAKCISSLNKEDWNEVNTLKT